MSKSPFVKFIVAGIISIILATLLELLHNFSDGEGVIMVYTLFNLFVSYAVLCGLEDLKK